MVISEMEGVKISELSKQLNDLYHTSHLSTRQVNDINHLFLESGQRYKMRIQIWSEMSEAKQINILKIYSPPMSRYFLLTFIYLIKRKDIALICLLLSCVLE